MKKITLLSILVTLLLVACNSKDASNTSAENSGAIVDSTTADPAHASQNSAAWIGTYKGVLPCADCEGIKTRLILKADNTYSLQTKYLGKGDGQLHKLTGGFTWNASANTVQLDGIKNAPNQYLVGENQLTQLDMSGNRITGALAEKYVLTKQVAESQ